MAVAAFALVSAGIWTGRRDPLLDGSLLYLARVVQLGTYFLAAFFFRNHLPSINRLASAVVVCYGVHLALYFVSLAIAPERLFDSPIDMLSSVFSGVANAGALLLLAHAISSFSPKYGTLGMVGAYALTEVLFAATAVLPSEAIAVSQPVLKIAGLAALLAMLVFKRSAAISETEHPLQYGIAHESENAQRPLRFLVSGADWVFQIIIAALIPFIFGFMSQLLSADGLSAGLHDTANEIVALAAMAALIAFCFARGAKLGFNDLFVTVILLNGTGLLLLPGLWEQGSPYAGTLFKCSITVYQAMLWALLARKAFEDPRHTYLYFGIFAGFANVTYGRLLEPLVMRDAAVVDGALLSSVSLAFLWLLLLCCLVLFVLQRATHVPFGSGGRERANVDRASDGGFSVEDGRGFEDRVSVAAEAVWQDSFASGVNTLAERASLSPREKEVLIEILHGYSMSNVAKKLFISPETVRTHMKNIYQKTGTSNKQALIKAIDDFDRRNGPEEK